MKFVYGLFGGMLMKMGNVVNGFAANKGLNDLTTAYKDKPLEIDGNKFGQGQKVDGEFIVFSNDENPECNKLIVTSMKSTTGIETMVYIAF